jgi:hypothetical protein
MALAEAEYDVTAMAFDSERQNRGGHGPQPGDERLFVRFFWHPRRNDTKSSEEGRPIYEDREYVEITVPGNRDMVVFKPATDMERERFPQHYAAFLNKAAMPNQGTPLSVWPALTKAQVEEMKFFNVHTIEQLADMADAQAQKFMGIQNLRTRARAFLEETGKSAAAEKLSAELAKRDEEIASLRAQMDEILKDRAAEKVSVKGK